MRAGISLGIGIAIATLALGCAMDHTRATDGERIVGDGGPETVGDATPPGGCRNDDMPEAFMDCLTIESEHVCGTWNGRRCVDGQWLCPPGTAPQGMGCWCSSTVDHDPACVCTPSGWQCPNDPPPDAGIDAAFACPSDPSSLVGMSCAREGQSCGTCPSPCSGACNLVTCVGHTWQALDLGCADPFFACGAGTMCNRSSEYCEHVLSDVAGMPDGYACLRFPPGCGVDCSCFASPHADHCTDDHAGGVTVTLGGG